MPLYNLYLYTICGGSGRNSRVLFWWNVIVTDWFCRIRNISSIIPNVHKQDMEDCVTMGVRFFAASLIPAGYSRTSKDLFILSQASHQILKDCLKNLVIWWISLSGITSVHIYCGFWNGISLPASGYILQLKI